MAMNYFTDNSDASDAQSSVNSLDDKLKRDQYNRQASLFEIFSSSMYLKPLFISLMLMLFQQFSGIKVISSYIVQIFENAGSKFDANICSIVVGVIQVTGTSLSIIVVDKYGRRPLLIVSELLISFSFAMLGTFFYLKESSSPCGSSNYCQEPYTVANTLDTLAFLPLASIVTFATAYSLGMGPLPWVLNAELFSEEAKAKSAALCASSNWIFSFIAVKFFPTLEASIGAGISYLSFSVFAAGGSFLIWMLVPETKGKTEEEIQQQFGKGSAGEREQMKVHFDEIIVSQELQQPFLVKDR